MLSQFADYDNWFFAIFRMSAGQLVEQLASIGFGLFVCICGL